MTLAREARTGVFYRPEYNRPGMWVTDLNIIHEVIHIDCYGVQRLAGEGFVPRTIVDVGAHIGCFSVLAHRVWPDADIIAVEANPGNIEALRANIGAFATIVEAALTYEPGEMKLYSSLHEAGVNTGGSFVGPGDVEPPTGAHGESYVTTGPVRKTTLEALYPAHWWGVDLLKVDAEGKGDYGTEWSIFRNADLGRIRRMVGEFHGDLAEGDRLGEIKFREVVDSGALAEWAVTVLRGGEYGQFDMTNRSLAPDAQRRAPPSRP